MPSDDMVSQMSAKNMCDRPFLPTSRRYSTRIVAVFVLILACLTSSATAAPQPAARSTVRLVSVTVSSGDVIHVRGTVRPVVDDVRVSLQLRTAHGTFSISASVPTGESRIIIRVVLSHGHRVLETGSADVVSMPRISVRGSKTSQPPATPTPAVNPPAATMPLPSNPLPVSPELPAPPSLPSPLPPSPAPTCPTGELGEPPNCQAPPSPDKGSILHAGEELTAGQYLESSDGHYRLVMQSDGNLVLYQEGNALWSSETGGNPGSYAIMEGEGNLVVYDGTTAKWNSSTWGFPGAYLSLQSEGNLVLYQDGHPLWDWGSGYLANELNQWKLEPGAYLLSPNHEYELVMQSSDGNLVLYHNGQALWSTQTGGNPGSYAIMQSDGNFVIYKPHSGPWSTGTSGHPGAFLRVQNDSNVVVYDGDTPLWDWGSGLLGGGGGGGGATAAETAAVNWAVARIGSGSFYDLCLTFVQDAYQDGAGLNIQPLTKYGAFNSNTYPQMVWDDGFNSGTTGGSNTTPPYGALVFFNDPSDYEYSHVTIMGSGGEMISSPDAFDESAVHEETLAQAAHSGAYSAYVGWWLPDG